MLALNDALMAQAQALRMIESALWVIAAVQATRLAVDLLRCLSRLRRP